MASRVPVGAGVMMSRLSWGVLVAAFALAACSGSGKSGGGGGAPEECPSGTVRDGERCVVACEGGSRCGETCCAAGSVCAAPNQCVAAQSCGPGQPACPDGQGCLSGRCGTKDLACTWKPPQGEFNPRIAWAWTGSNALPDYKHVLSSPVVVPLTRQPVDAFAPPAVVFAAGIGTVGAGTQVPAVLRAVGGRDGVELWTTGPDHLVNALSGIAAGDLDGDGTTEIVAARLPVGPNGGDPATEGLVAFGNDGRFLWDAPLPAVAGSPAGTRSVYWGAPSIGNLTGGREANVVIGATVLDARGQVVCRGTAGQGANSLGPISVLADVDLDGNLDIVTGNTVYGGDCQPKAGWPNGQPDGLVAVADITGDSHPEIVVVRSGSVRMQDWQGRVIWGPVAIPPAGAGSIGGAPTIADFDGDGQLEIGVASNSTYTVFEPTGAVLWSRPTQDQSAVTGSSVFDFQRDGRAEVVYGDECYTRVYDGLTGDTLFSGKNPSCTVHENPVIADVDRDGRAEIVVGTNSVCDIRCEWEPGVLTSHYGSGLHGVTVFKDARDLWVGTRPIWNQHAYHVTNVSDDGSIPVKEQSHWLDAATNMFRANPVGNPDYSAPDLTAELRDVKLSTASCPQTLKLTLKVWNRGAVLVSQGVPIAVYAGAAGGTPVVVARTATAILPGSSETVTIDIPGSPTGQDFTLVVNDDGSGQGVVGECDRANNSVPLAQLRCTAVNN
jgi:hypothetical protein